MARRVPVRIHAVVVAMLLGVSLLASACGGTSSPSRATATAAKHYVQVGGHPVLVPSDDGAAITEVTGSGTNIIITATGFEPKVLSAPRGKAITWTNLTNQVQEVNFEYSTVRSGPIAPGKTFTWSSKTLISIRYDSTRGFSGNVLVGVFGS